MATQDGGTERLVRSRQRVADHGEVFTPAWLVTDMLDLVKSETERIDSRFLEPACGSGNFLIPVLERKFATVKARHGASDFERKHYALFALMCVYGIELLADNVAECHARLVAAFAKFVKADELWTSAARNVVELNVVQGDALTMKNSVGGDILFPEWGYLGRGKFQRRDFRFENLTERSSNGIGLFTHFQEHDVFVPVTMFEPMTVQGLAA